MNRSMKCPTCRFENLADSLFCEQCSTPLETACPRCAAGNRADARFCRKCGAALPGSRQSSSPLTANNLPANNLLRSPLSYTPKHLAEKILTSRTALEGERKTITALFADIKGSMELLEDLDPEEARHLIDPALEIMMDAVHRYEGYVAQSTGDGIFALFGAPIAHEDHPQRACYAALKMQEEMRGYAEQVRRERGVNLQARVGLNTGEVVLRSIRTDDLHTDYTPIGHSTSLAARMESLATPGSIVVSEHTQKLIEGYLQLKALGEAKVKGVSEPVRIYEVTGVGPLRSRMEVSLRRGLVRFVGRHQEMEQLHRAWQAALQGHGQIVAVTGEAGVGKSRLFHEFKIPLQAQCLLLEAFSVSHGKAYAYLPLIDLLKSYFRITLEDDERTRREKVTGKVLTLDRTLEPTLPYVFSLLGISDPAASLQQMDAQIRRQRTMEAVKRLLVRETLNQPLVLIFEDLHWIDGETQAFLDLLADAVATARLLLLVNYRPEYRYGWGSKSCATQLGLEPLGGEDARELLTALVGDGLEPLKKLILQKTEGNPFFMEEVVQTLAEEDILTGERGHYHLEKPATELHVPATVQGVLAARVDRLPEDGKKLLQTLAVIGKEFSFALVVKTTEQPEGELHQLLNHLQAGEYVYEQPAFPEPEYTFKHALTQEVAYHSVLVERRKVLHERTGRAMEELYGDNLDEHYGELAHHYSHTDNTAKAVEYLHLAGQQAAERSAYDEAIGRLAKGLELIGELPEGPERDGQELLLQVALGPVLRETRGFTAPEVKKAYARARELCEGVGKTSLHFAALDGLWLFHQIRGDLDEARNLARQLLDLAERSQDSSLLSRAHNPVGQTLYWCGELQEALVHLQQAFDLANPQKYRPAILDGEELQRLLANRSYQASALWNLGYSDQALGASRATVALAQQRPGALALALLWNAGLCQLLGESQAALAGADALITLSTEHGFPQYMAFGMLTRGCALAELGQTEEGIAQQRAALDAIRAAGAELARPYYLGLLAETYGHVGQPEEGLGVIADAFEVMHRTGQRLFASYLRRVKGNLLVTLSHDRHAEAEECFRHAIEIAREQAYKRAELWSATCLARLYKKQGKTEEARELLAEIYGWFTEGFDFRDLKEAKALLEELA